MLKIFILNLLLIKSLVFCTFNINMTIYHQMPPIYLMDDYDKCFEESTISESIAAAVTPTYCYVQSFIKPNITSDLSNFIQEVSSDYKRHYRHDYLNRGICLNWCIGKIEKFNGITKMKYYQVKFPLDSKPFNTDSHDIFENALIDRNKYNKIINMCINYDLEEQYKNDGLRAYSEILYCIRNTNEFPLDKYDIGFLLITICIILLTIMSTYYDYYYLRNKFKLTNLKSLYFKMSDSSIFVSFSFPRNFNKLFSKKTSSSSSEISNDLQAIDAIRFLTMFTIIFGHCGMEMNYLPMSNPQFSERLFHEILPMLLLNGSVVIQTFFLISGFLLSIQFLKLKLKMKFHISHLWKAIIYRYLRLAPIYLYLIFFNATWFIRLQNGPIWKFMAETERTYCRKNWWTNLLFINNIMNTNEPCHQPGWYLAADFQLFIVGVLLHLLFWRFSKCMKYVLSVIVLMTYLIPAVITYINKYEGIFLISLQQERYLHLNDEMYHKYYIPFYTNLGGYITGLIGGILYFKCKYEWNINLKNCKLFVTVWYFEVPIGLTILLLSFIFYEYEFEKPQFWIALYSSVHKNLWAIDHTMGILGFAFGIGGVMRKFMHLRIFEPLGRLTFCAYLVHINIIRLIDGNMKLPPYQSLIANIKNIMITFVFSYTLAFIFYVIVELPIVNVLKCLFYQKQTTDKLMTTTSKIDSIKNIAELQSVETITSTISLNKDVLENETIEMTTTDSTKL